MDSLQKRSYHSTESDQQVNYLSSQYITEQTPRKLKNQILVQDQQTKMPIRKSNNFQRLNQSTILDEGAQNKDLKNETVKALRSQQNHVKIFE